MLRVAESFLHQLLYALLGELRQYPHDDEFKNGIRYMLVHVLVTPNIQLYLNISSPLVLVLSTEELSGHSRGQQ